MSRPGRIDGVLLGAVVLLCLLGLVMVYSSSAILALRDRHSEIAYLADQASKLLVGGLVLSVLANVSYRRWNSWVAVAALGSFFAIMSLQVLGMGVVQDDSGTNRGFGIGGIRIQPVEFARLALVLFLAYYVSNRSHWREGRWRGLFEPLAAIFVLALLAKLLPNLSSAVLIATLGVSLLWVAGQPIRRLLITLVPGVVLLGLSLRGYQLDRITDFFAHRGGEAKLGYQVEQSLIALGSGGLWGQGLGQGLQKFFYLPLPHSDFILGIVGEELGFLGVAILFTLYLVVIARGLRISRLAPDVFGQTLALGLTVSLGLNFLLHSVVVLGLGPVTGVPLPFLSHGGSSLLANLAAMGVLLSISRAAQPEPGVRAVDEWRWMGSPTRA